MSQFTGEHDEMGLQECGFNWYTRVSVCKHTTNGSRITKRPYCFQLLPYVAVNVTLVPVTLLLAASQIEK